MSTAPPLPAALQHVTLLTGNVRMSPACEVTPETRALVRPLLHEGGELPAPFERYRLVVVSNAPGALVAAIRHGHRDDAGTLVVFAVGRDASHEARIAWASLVAMQRSVLGDEIQQRRSALAARFAGSMARLDPETPPEAPWLAVAILPGVATDPHACLWLADCERSVAWTWMEVTP